MEAMFSHVVVGTNDLEKSKRFYDAVLGALGYAEGVSDDNDKRRRYVYRAGTGLFIITQPLNGQPATSANGGTSRSIGGTPPGSPTVAHRLKRLPACVRPRQAASILPISAIRTATSSAPYIACRPETNHGAKGAPNQRRR
jgi:catechol 2,3-dioxygenase-like lactoylglutathione lyase family enzyme